MQTQRGKCCRQRERLPERTLCGSEPQIFQNSKTSLNRDVQDRTYMQAGGWSRLTRLWLEGDEWKSDVMDNNNNNNSLGYFEMWKEDCPETKMEKRRPGGRHLEMINAWPQGVSSSTGWKGRCPAGGADRLSVGCEVRGKRRLKDDHSVLSCFYWGWGRVGGKKTFLSKHSQAYRKVARIKIVQSTPVHSLRCPYP